MDAISEIPPEAQQAHRVPTGLGDLYVVERGQGDETVVLWPSIFTDHRIYDRVTDLLRDRYRFLLIDGPGHGRSEGPTTTFSMAACGDAVRDVMNHFGLSRAVIGGTSWGGLAAAEVALAVPERVTALVLMNTPMEIDGTRPGLAARSIAFGARWALGAALFHEGIANRFFSPEALVADPGRKASFHDMLARADAPALSAAVRSVLLRGSPLEARMPDLTVPVLVIAGTGDAMYPIDAQAAAAMCAPRGRFEPVGGKHISVVEVPEAVAGSIDRFIQEEAGR